jgi:hypothetical protein
MTALRNAGFTILIAAIFVPLAVLCSGCPEETGGIECGPPITSAGEDQTDCTVGRMVILRGSVRLPPEAEQVCLTEKDTLTFTWEKVSGPDMELLDSSQREASFIPAEAGIYKVRFAATYPVTEVNKEAKISQWDTVTIECAAVICDPPTSDAGAAQEISTTLGTPVSATLDGCASHPPNQEGCSCGPLTYAWTTSSGATITSADQCSTNVDLPDVGVYEFQLEVTDSCGTDGRTATHTSTVTITVVEREGCGGALNVTVIDGMTGDALAGAHVTVVDAGDATQTIDTDAAGLAAFSGLTQGTRKYITAVSDETVTAIRYLTPHDRPRYETTTLVDHCASNVTLPLQQTRSGAWSGAYGTVVAKVPSSIFNMLPHSWKCAGDCQPNPGCNPSQDDYCCDETYYCEMDATTPCGPIPENPDYGSCTPRSLLPFFSLGDNNVSGQFRVVITTPMFPADNFAHFPVSSMFAPPPGEDALLPGNLTTDDTFLNGLAPSLGLDPWGGTCVRTSDCPNATDYVCEQDPQGDYRCKDKNPLRNLEMRVPAGSSKVFVTLGIINVNMMDLLPVLLPFLTSDAEVEFDIAALLGAFKMRTMHICPLTINVTADTDNDISSDLAGITMADCWSIDYQQKDSTIALKDPTATGVDSCSSDADCCDTSGNCGWPDSGKKCLENPDGTAGTGCYMPMFRVEIVSGDYVTVLPPATGFDPGATKADARLCAQVPAQADFEVMCATTTPNIYEPCDPRDIRTLDVPDDHKCSFTYGLSLTALDFPVGHSALPEGGRVLIGFDFNRTPLSENLAPTFLVPQLACNELTRAGINIVQLYMRNVTTLPDGTYDALPGYLGATAYSTSNAAEMQLANFVSQLESTGIPDAGFRVKVTFVAENPSVFPPTLEKTYAYAAGVNEPTAGTHDLPGSVTVTVDPSQEMIGLLLHKTDRVDNSGVIDVITDHWWRIYAPTTATTITLPASADPFASGDEVWLGLFGAAFRVPFDFDLFNPDLVVKRQASHTRDAYALKKP